MDLNGKSIKNIVKGVGIALIVTIISLIIFSLVLTYTDISESVINPVTIVITGISILIGASITGIKIKRNGLINGAVIGLIYMLVIYFVSSILNWNFKLNLQALIFSGVGIVFGILGGIIGVNKK